MTNSIAIVIVNWNSGHQLRASIDSITRYAQGLTHQTIVVDNGSSDGSDSSAEGLTDVILIRAGVNLGFGKACNLGAQHSKSDYLLFLNPDAGLYADTLPKTLAYMQEPANAKVGICGVQLIDEAGNISRHCARFPSAGGLIANAFGLDRLFPRLGHVMAEWDHAQVCEVDHVIGAFFLIRRELFDALSGFDERFFMYLEDLDFSCRARQAGWRTVYLADAQAFHAGGGTSKQIKARRLFYSLRSRLLYSFKHFSMVGGFAILLTTLLIEPVSRSAQALLRLSLPSFKETWVAYGLLWRWLPQWVLNKESK